MGKVCCPMEELKLSMTVFQNELPGVLITSTSTAVFLCGKSQFSLHGNNRSSVLCCFCKNDYCKKFQFVRIVHAACIILNRKIAVLLSNDEYDIIKVIIPNSVNFAEPVLYIYKRHLIFNIRRILLCRLTKTN